MRPAALLALVAAVLVSAESYAQTPRPDRPKFDETTPVTRNMRLSATIFAGSITVRPWDKEAVRVEAEHSSRDRVSVRASEAVLRVSSSSERGVSRSVDFVLTVPTWMPVTVNGTYVDVELEGLQADVSVETVGGDIRLRGGSGTVKLKSVEGAIEVEGSKGRLALNTVNERIVVRDTTGEVLAETVNGDVSLERVDATAIDVATVNGDVRYEGTVRDGGSYRFATHHGDVEMRVPDAVNASVFVRLYRGDFSSHFQVQVPPATGPADGGRRTRRNRRFDFTLGTGAARIELESFGGDVQLFRQSMVKPRPNPRQED